MDAGNVFCETGTLVHNILGLHKDVATCVAHKVANSSFYVISACTIVIIIIYMQLATHRMPFLTPVEDIICDLPDGGVVFYHEPIIGMSNM